MENKFLKSFLFAFRGIGFLIHERNFKIHLSVFAGVLLLGFILDLNPLEWSVILLTSGSVLLCEGFNTALEKLLDFLHPKHHPTVGKIKDIAAGTVLISAIISVIIGAIVFLPKLYKLYIF